MTPIERQEGKCGQCGQPKANAPQFWEEPGQSGTVHGVICDACCPHRFRHEFHDGKREYLNDVCADGCGRRLGKEVPIWFDQPCPPPADAKESKQQVYERVTRLASQDQADLIAKPDPKPEGWREAPCLFSEDVDVNYCVAHGQFQPESKKCPMTLERERNAALDEAAGEASKWETEIPEEISAQFDVNLTDVYAFRAGVKAAIAAITNLKRLK